MCLSVFEGLLRVEAQIKWNKSSAWHTSIQPHFFFEWVHTLPTLGRRRASLSNPYIFCMFRLRTKHVHSYMCLRAARIEHWGLLYTYMCVCVRVRVCARACVWVCVCVFSDTRPLSCEWKYEKYITLYMWGATPEELWAWLGDNYKILFLIELTEEV